jgi:hypothetical protein
LHFFARHLDLIGDAIGPSAPLRIQGRRDLAQPPEGMAVTFDGGRSGGDRINRASGGARLAGTFFYYDKFH